MCLKIRFTSVIKHIGLLSFLTLSYINVAGQAKDALIKNIRAEYQKINKDASLKTIALKQEQFLQHATDGGGSLAGYFKKDSIYKMVLSVGLSYGVKTFEYYLKNNNLIFVYETEEYHAYNDATGELNYLKLTKAFEGRYYFNQGKLIETHKKGKKRFDETTGVPVKEVLEDVSNYTKLLKAHLKK